MDVAESAQLTLSSPPTSTMESAVSRRAPDPPSATPKQIHAPTATVSGPVISRPISLPAARSPPGGSGVSWMAETMFRRLTRQEETVTTAKVRSTPSA